MPQEVIDILRYAAERAGESASELESAWQMKEGSSDWNIVAKELDRCADRLQKLLF